jgi:delta 1-pyrroline-5-carboxylate dehydrogenase
MRREYHRRHWRFCPGVGEEVGPTLVEHPTTAFVVFTGSKAVGLSLIETAAVHRAGQRHVKRVVAEMGGKNAIVVDADADFDEAVPAIVSSAFGYAGQKCSAAARLIAVGTVHDELLERVIGATAIVPVGHARELRTVVGPLIDEDAYRRVRAYTDCQGVVYRREAVPAGGWYVGPTVIVARDSQAAVVREEIFGPVLVVLRADDFEHALALANETDYALTGGLFSRLPDHVRRAGEDFRAGNLYVNRGITGARVGRQPFGGYACRGSGSKAGGPDYLLQFVEPRVVTENTIPAGISRARARSEDAVTYGDASVRPPLARKVIACPRTSGRSRMPWPVGGGKRQSPATPSGASSGAIGGQRDRAGERLGERIGDDQVADALLHEDRSRSGGRGLRGGARARTRNRRRDRAGSASRAWRLRGAA